MPLKDLPAATVIHAVEMYPGLGAKLAKSAGSSAQLVAVEGEIATIKMPSGEIRKVSANCRAVVGVVGNSEHANQSLGKAGRRRWLGRRPRVRGVAMNPVDHPMGGGRGHGKGGNIPRSPWNQQTRGLKTRSTKKAFGWMIVSDRRKNKVK